MEQKWKYITQNCYTSLPIGSEFPTLLYQISKEEYYSIPCMTKSPLGFY